MKPDPRNRFLMELTDIEIEQPRTMKIETVITRKPRRDHVQVEITATQAIQALQEELVKRINQELVSLQLPESELKIPHHGFHCFYLKDGTLRAYHEEGRHPRNTETDVEIKWGVDRFKRILEHHSNLQALHESGFLAEKR